MGVFQRHARAAVGVEAHAQHQPLQGHLSHTHQHGRGLRIDGLTRIEHDRCAHVVAAVEQALLRAQQIALAVFLPFGQARQPLRNGCVVPLRALYLRLAITKNRARVVQHLQAGAAGVGVDFGFAAAERGGGKAFGLQVLQGLRFGTRPSLLRKRVAHGQTPVLAQHGQLFPGGCVVAGSALYLQIKLANLRARPGVDGDGHPRNAASLRRSGVQSLIDLRREITLCGQQIADLRVGQLQQALQFGVVEIGHLLIALQIQKTIHQAANG